MLSICFINYDYNRLIIDFTLQMVWSRVRSQHPRDGPLGSITRGPVQLLFTSIHHQDCANACRWVKINYNIYKNVGKFVIYFFM